MPSRNIVKNFDVDEYYHVYNRGVEKRRIYMDDEDYAVFLNLMKRYVSPEPVKDHKGRQYEHLSDRLEIIAFCLMPNHFHLLVYEKDNASLTYFMRAVAAAYTVYFNKKYKRVGSLFQATYKASRISSNSYLEHITRYIHLNPEDYMGWEWSSCSMYLGRKKYEWVHPERITITTKEQHEKYRLFLADIADYEDMQDKTLQSRADE